jgi:ABC-type antimicrobial peptide transport system permease subunit
MEIVRSIGVPTLGGIGVGMIGAVFGGRLLTSLLVGVSPTDPYILGAVGALLFATAGAATLIPVIRAVRIDPTESLRSE